MENKIVIDERNVYGQKLYYPANPTAEYLATIADTETLTLRTLRVAKKMGFIVEMLQQDIPHILRDKE